MFDAQKMWDENATEYIEAIQANADLYKRHINFPELEKLLPINIENMNGLDIGCGAGNYTKKIAELCRDIVGIDFSQKFIDHFKKNITGTNIKFFCCAATKLPFDDNTFDFALSIHCLMDIPLLETGKALKEAHRVLIENGTLLISIPHPLWSKDMEWVKDNNGSKVGAIIKNYFKSKNQVDINTWCFEGNTSQKFKTPYFSRSITDWFNDISSAGFFIKEIIEPCASREIISQYPALDGAAIVPYSLIFKRCKLQGVQLRRARSPD